MAGMVLRVPVTSKIRSAVRSVPSTVSVRGAVKCPVAW